MRVALTFSKSSANTGTSSIQGTLKIEPSPSGLPDVVIVASQEPAPSIHITLYAYNILGGDVFEGYVESNAIQLNVFMCNSDPNYFVGQPMWGTENVIRITTNEGITTDPWSGNMQTSFDVQNYVKVDNDWEDRLTKLPYLFVEANGNNVNQFCYTKITADELRDWIENGSGTVSGFRTLRW